MRFSTTPRPATTESIFPPKEIREQTAARRAWLAAKLAEVTAAGRIAKIVGQGSYQAISMKIVKTETFVHQLRGLCQACGGEWAMVGGFISHHGYQRPGYGWQTASCMGARELPLSDDITVAVRLLTMLKTTRTDREVLLDQLRANTIPSLTVLVRGQYDYRTGKRSPDQHVVIAKGHPRFAHEVERRIADTESEVRHLAADIAVVTKRIADFKTEQFAGTTREVLVAK